MRLQYGALCGLVLCTLASCSPSSSPPRASASANVAAGVAVVTGGIEPCRGISYPTDPKYAAGTVTVLRGQVSWRSIGAGASRIVFPADVAGRASVDVNGMYRFVLVPGHYVLVATFAPPSNVQPYAEVSLHGGSKVEAVIPNMCL